MPEVSNGRTAQEQLYKIDRDLLITDLAMPGMDGMDGIESLLTTDRPALS